ncbi:MAG: BLUF domain-containing protein [Bacteroidota bacterium]
MAPPLPGEAPPQVHALFYRSLATRPMSDLDLHRLAVRAAESNARLGVTGLLLYTRVIEGEGGLFAQWIEGPEARVRALYYDRIAHDPRHTDCEVVFDGPAREATGHDERQFSRWGMSGIVERPGLFPVSLESFLERVPMYLYDPATRSYV